MLNSSLIKMFPSEVKGTFLGSFLLYVFISAVGVEVGFGGRVCVCACTMCLRQS